VIVWINGAFGAGKSTVESALRTADPTLRHFDPEWIGYILQRVVPVPTGDFRDLPLWRSLTVGFLSGLTATYGGVWLVPMTVLDPDHRAEIIGGLRARGIPVRHVVLTVSEQSLRRRIDADDAPAGARGWRHARVERALRELSGLADREPDTFEVDNDGRPPAEVAADIAKLVVPPGRDAPDTL
jgi:hypothetical protein